MEFASDPLPLFVERDAVAGVGAFGEREDDSGLGSEGDEHLDGPGGERLPPLLPVDGERPENPSPGPNGAAAKGP